jgi:undecaprenyl pyrophosphate phosphatase UppP
MMKTTRVETDASLFLGVLLGALTAFVTGGSVSRFVFGGHFFDPIVLVGAFVLVPIVLIVGSRRSKRQPPKQAVPPTEEERDD